MKKAISIILCLAVLASLALPICAAEYPELSGRAEMISFTKYGNVFISLTKEELLSAGYTYGDMVTVAFLDQTMDLPLCSDVSDVDSGEPGVFARSKDTYVMLAINMGDFASTYGLAVKTTKADQSYEWSWAEGVESPVYFTITMKEPGGYLDQYYLHQLSYTDARGDYPDLSDEEFANFRAVQTTGMGRNILYRAASPINPIHNRNTYADAAIQGAGVTVVMNLADDEDTARAYEGFSQSYYAGASFIALNMGVDFFADEFREKLAQGMRFFARNPGVYMLHCTEGKNRAGFVAAILECLMGASLQEVEADYMCSFYNYYGITPEDPRYEPVLSGGIVKSLSRAFGVNDLQSADLSACAAAYLKDCGLTDQELAALRTNLSAVNDEEEVLTRGEFVMGLFDLSGVKDMEPDDQVYFEDVPLSGKLALAVRWAVGNGIVKGYGNGRFGPDDPVTREQMAVMLYRCAQTQGETDVQTFPLDFPDADEVSDWAEEAMCWAVMNGIIIGTDKGLEPKALATDDQLALVLQRFAAAMDASAPLSLWTEEAEAAAELRAYVDAVTDESSPDFIPVEDRIAVFDLDGTLFCETDPNYFDYMLLMYRVLEDPAYKDLASDFEREVANKIKEQNETGASFSGLEVDHGRAVASAFAGMTIAEFNAYIQAFKKQPMPSYAGMTRGEGFYRPMVQVINYLQANDFTVYIVSGTDRLIVRGIVDNSPLNIPNRQIIGSDETIVASNQNGADGLSYVFTEGDELILGGEFLIKNLKMNKVSVIMQEIGQQPVLSFGNSTGDSSMAEYVTSGNPYRSLAFMLCCDDTLRENGSQTKADKMYALCQEFGWVPVSMKNDWKTIYGEGVTYLPGADGELRPAA